jgi:integral membrane protein
VDDTAVPARPRGPEVEHLRPALRRYQVLAYVVGVLLVVLSIGVVLKYLTTEGTNPQRTGEFITQWVGIAHGWLYMLFLVLAALLARAARWSIPFTVLVLLSGLVPFGTFVAERLATARTLDPSRRTP